MGTQLSRNRQVPAASGGHEALRCIAPSVAPGSFFRDWIRYDGCFALGNAIRWSLTHFMPGVGLITSRADSFEAYRNIRDKGATGLAQSE